MVAAIGPRNAGGEIHGMDIAALPAIACLKSPKIRNHNRAADGVAQRSHPRARGWIVSIDGAVAEIAHQQVIGEITETGGSDSQSPGSVEVPAGDQVLEQIAGSVEDAHVSQAGAAI